MKTKKSKHNKRGGGSSSSTKRKLSELKKKIATRKIQKIFRKKNISKSKSRKKLSSLKKKFATRKIQKAFRKDKCVICLDRINKNIKNKCSRHGFHDDCINHWINIGNHICPTCRLPLNLIEPTRNSIDNQLLTSYIISFRENITQLNELRDELNDLDPIYLEENDSTNQEINNILQQSEHFINIIQNQNNITQEIINNMEHTKLNGENLINSIRNDYIPTLEEMLNIRNETTQILPYHT
jgi:hypothetical protein